VLDVLVPEVVLQSPRVVAVVGELEPTGMANHVRVDREWHLGGLPRRWTSRCADRTEKDRKIPPDVLSAMHACVQQLRVTFLPRAQPI
jgi:hypothetical protein